jgi:hypothetical protein
MKPNEKATQVMILSGLVHLSIISLIPDEEPQLRYQFVFQY